MKVGRRLATKLLNVTKFVLGIGADADQAGVVEPEPVDAAMLARLDGVVAEATTAFDGFDYARALERTEEFFWWFCDDYVELVKGRAYGSRGDRRRGIGARRAAHSTRRAAAAARPDAPVRRRGGVELVARRQRPRRRLAGRRGRRRRPELSLDPISEVLASVRRVKTEAKVSQRAAVATLDVRGPADWLASIEAARDDLTEALSVTTLTLREADDVTIAATLA